MRTVVRPVLLVVSLVFSLAQSLRAQPLANIETVTVGDAGNAADSTGYGAVAYEFAIGKYEVTIGHYTSFLNAVAATDTYSLYNPNMGSDLNIAGISQIGSSGDFSYFVFGSANRPISYVSWFDAARFANWVNNGATNGVGTETGAYSLNGATSGVSFTKNNGATWWIPSEDEWYKAAYYDPSPSGPVADDYWLYPTRSDSAPGNAIGATTNQANYYAGDYSTTQSASYSRRQNYLADGGAYSGSGSYYDTHDQGGNVYEWNDAVIDSSRGLRGGSWDSDDGVLQSSNRNYNFEPSFESSLVGFRVATVPEPSTYALLLMTGAGALWWAKRRR